MARLLFIWYKRSKGILEGGGQGSTRNYTQLCNLLGKDNVDSFYVHDEYRKKTLWGYVKGVFFTPFGYYYGLTPGRVRSIVRIAKGEQALEPDRSNASAKECASDRSNASGKSALRLKTLLRTEAISPHLTTSSSWTGACSASWPSSSRKRATRGA